MKLYSVFVSFALICTKALCACGPGPGEQQPSGPSSPRPVDDLADVSSADAGGFHSIAVTGSSIEKLASHGWGHNIHGQVGAGEAHVSDAVERPTQLPGAHQWKEVSCGALHTLAVDHDGRLFAWGHNERGQLGHGDAGWESDRHEPAQVGVDSDWSAVAAGGEHSLALKNDGSLWAFGYNYSGQLGLGVEDSLVTSPRRVDEASDWTMVSAGAHFSLALKSDGALFAWGSNRYGQLGLGDLDIPRKREPTKVEGASWVAASAGGEHALGIRPDGSLWAWGRSQRGQTGATRSDDDPLAAPSRVSSDGDYEKVSAGYFHSLASRSDGSLWAFGDSEFGQLGIGVSGRGEMREEPTRVEGAEVWDLFSAGFFHSLAVFEGRLYTWGRNELGQLGN